MVTDTHPQDYEKNYVIVPQLVKICAYCGGWISNLPKTRAPGCISCGRVQFIEMMENEVPEYRTDLQTIKDYISDQNTAMIAYAAEVAMQEGEREKAEILQEWREYWNSDEFAANVRDSSNDTMSGSLEDAGLGGAGII